jgi:hypothetical protein
MIPGKVLIYNFFRITYSLALAKFLFLAFSSQDPHNTMVVSCRAKPFPGECSSWQWQYFFLSEGLGCFSQDPKIAFSILRMAFTHSF